MTIVSANQARRNFAELLETAFYQNSQIHIHRNRKPMARLVGEPVMQAIEQLIADDPGLADSLALMLNDDLQRTIEQSHQEARAGKLIPIEEALQ